MAEEGGGIDRKGLPQSRQVLRCRPVMFIVLFCFISKGSVNLETAAFIVNV